MLYQFKTTATMKEYNRRKWWIDSGIVREITIEADTITAAVKEYQKEVHDRFYIDISDNAIKTKSPMYRDTKTGEPVQVGFVITASTDFDNDRRGWVKQFIDLYINIRIFA
ncbi:MAG: hypothetical protein J6K51_02000 [Clostridia bacterium]|nr:hypothetical protein [Clostridia bacterium]